MTCEHPPVAILRMRFKQPGGLAGQPLHSAFCFIGCENLSDNNYKFDSMEQGALFARVRDASTHYQVLDVPVGDIDANIKKSYLKVPRCLAPAPQSSYVPVQLAKVLHPDKCDLPGATGVFQKAAHNTHSEQ